MKRFGPLAWISAIALMAPTARADDDSKEKGRVTVLGTLRGEISQVRDGGHLFEVKYTDLVTVNGPRLIQLPILRNSKIRLPNPNQTLKERTKEVELRLLPDAKVRLTIKTFAETRKKETDKESKEEAKKDEGKPAKGEKKEKDTLPGRPGEPSQLAKGQFVVVTVGREDFQNYSRYVATRVIVIGEK